MADVKVLWELPTTRDSGRPLKVEDIDYVRLEMSADEGVNFVTIDVFAPDVLETIVPELEIGTWVFRGTVVDKKARESDPVVASIVIEDESAPGPLKLFLSLA